MWTGPCPPLGTRLISPTLVMLSSLFQARTYQACSCFRAFVQAVSSAWKAFPSFWRASSSSSFRSQIRCHLIATCPHHPCKGTVPSTFCMSLSCQHHPYHPLKWSVYWLACVPVTPPPTAARDRDTHTAGTLVPWTAQHIVGNQHVLGELPCFICELLSLVQSSFVFRVCCTLFKNWSRILSREETDLPRTTGLLVVNGKDETWPRVPDI